MKLLSDADKLAIRKAIGDLSETFFVTPIFYHYAGDSVDVWNEDRGDQSYYTIQLSAMTEYGATEDIELDKDGSKDYEQVTLTFNLEDLEKVGFVDSTYKHLFGQETDYFTCRGKVYKVTDIWYDGPLDSKNALILMRGRLTHEGQDFSGKQITNYSEIWQ